MTERYRRSTPAPGDPTRIYTIDLATATVIGVPIELVGSPAGLPEGNAVLNEDGTRAVQLMLEGSTTRVVVIDTTPATGAVVVNDATTVTGLPASSVRFSDDQSRVVVTTRTTTGGGGPSATTTRVAVVEVGTGDQLGVTYQVNGLLQRAVEFSPDDDSTRLVLLTRSSVGSANVVVTVLDADTGLVVGAPISLGGAQTGVTFSADGHRLFATSATGTTTRVTSVNLVDGSSASVSLGIGVPVGALVIGSDGQTAFQTVIVTDAGTESTRLAIVDLSGAPTTVGVIALEGAQPTFGEVKSMLNGTRLIATTASDDTTTATVINTAPFVHNTVVAPATVGDPDPVTGVVVGKINATDPEDPLSYTVTTAPTNGDVTIDGAGVFTYTPTAAARRAAAASLGPDIDGFIVTVGDGHGGQVVSMVTVDIAPAGVLGQTAVAGTPSTSGATVGPNGTRAVQVTLDSAPAAVPRVVVIDTVTGLQVGETVMLPTAQSVGVPVFNAGGSRVAVVTSGFDAVLGTTLSSVSVIDTGSGEQVGETVTVTGESFFGVQFSALGGKAAMATVDSQGEVRVTVLDAVSGALIGTTQGVWSPRAPPPAGAVRRPPRPGWRWSRSAPVINSVSPTR